MAVALILTIFPMLFFGYFFVAEVASGGALGAFAAAVALFIGFVAWFRFLTVEKHLEEADIGHDDEDDLSPYEPEEEEPLEEEPEPYPQAA